MVKGLDLFRERFSGFADRYVLIGGAACAPRQVKAARTRRSPKRLFAVVAVSVNYPCYPSRGGSTTVVKKIRRRWRSASFRLFSENCVGCQAKC